MSAANKVWLFRVASKKEQGGGHVSRSLVLAKAWDSKVVFCLDTDTPYADTIKDAGFEVTYPNEIEDSYEGIFLDIYSTENFEQYRSKTKNLAIIEGFKDFYDKADIYIRPFSGEYSNRNGLVLKGLAYALVDKKYHLIQKEIKNKIETVSIAMGRYDSRNTTQFVLDVLNKRSENFHTNIVLGANAKHLKDIQKYLKQTYTKAYSLHLDLPDLVGIYKETDLFFSAGGGTALESVAMKTPSILMSFVEDQKKLAEDLSDAGCANYVGHYGDIEQNEIHKAIDSVSLLSNRENLLQNMCLIDTNGAQRIHDEITKYLEQQER